MATTEYTQFELTPLSSSDGSVATGQENAQVVSSSQTFSQEVSTVTKENIYSRVESLEKYIQDIYANQVKPNSDINFNNLTVSNRLVANFGKIANWDINAGVISSPSILLDSNNNRIILGNNDIRLDGKNKTISIGLSSDILLDATNSTMRLGTSASNITLDGVNKKIVSSNYVSGNFGSGFYLDSNLLAVGNIACRGIFRTAVFQADVINVIAGSFVVSPNGDKLDADMTAADNSTLTIEGNVTLAVNDILRIKCKNGASYEDEWMQVTSIAAAPVYTVTRDLAGSYGANDNPAWKKGAAVVDYGQSGDGGVYMTASDTNSPYLSIFTHAGSPWSALTTHLRLGNLNGFLGYSTDLYGIAIGTTDHYFKYDPTNGVRIKGSITIENPSDITTSSLNNDAGWTTSAIANSKITTFLQTSIPTSISVGDLWIDSDDNNKIYRAEMIGADQIAVGEWVVVPNLDKVTTFVQASVPTSTAIGDIWIDSDDNNHPYRAASIGADQIAVGEWVTIRDLTIAEALQDAADAQTSANTAQTTADAKIQTYYQSAMPLTEYTNVPDNATYNTYVGDLWYDTDTTQTWRYSKVVNGANFNYTFLEQTIPVSVFDTIDGKRTVFTAEPTIPYYVGDLWLTSLTAGTGDLKKCILERLTGAYTASDWVLATDYTEGADWSSNLLNIPGTLGAPAGAGLYLGATYMGYYDSAAWKTYMDSSGNFYLGGATGKLQWSAGTDTLTIEGTVNAITVSNTGHIKGGQTDYNTGTGFFLGYKTDAYKLSIGDADKYVRWDGSILSIRGASVFSEFNGSNVDGLTATNSNTTMSRKPINTYVYNSTAGNWDLNTVIIGYKDNAGNALDWDVSYDFYCRLACDTGIADSGGVAGAAMAWGLQNNTLKMTSGSLPTGATTAITTRHVLFINDKDGKLYASCANGTTQTTSEITGVTVGNENNYRIIFVTATSAKFYVNDVLKATLTTNLPTGTTDLPDIMFWGAVARNVSNAIDTVLYNNYKLIIG